jgi:DNA-binding transcriptional LysR family regulator
VDYNRAAVFVRVVKAGSFTAAAAKLGLPKSSLSRTVSRLEEDLGVRLLHRTTRKLALTEVGHAYYDAIAPTIDVLDEATSRAKENEAEARGLVRVSAPPDPTNLPVLIAEFTAKHPGIRVELCLTARFVDLLTENFDLAVRAGRLEDSSLVARRIGATTLVLAASPAYLRKRGRPRTIADLAAHDWVLYRATAGRAQLQLTGPDGDATIEVTGAIVADDMGFCRAAVEAGAGLGRLPVAAIVDAVAAGRLAHVMPEWSYDGGALYVVLPSAHFVPRRVALLRDFLIDRLSAQQAQLERVCRGEAPAARGAARKAARSA